MSTPYQDAIAVTGMAGRFPGAANIREFWANTLRGSEHITRTPGRGGAITRARAELAGIEGFDYEFFGISRRDAVTLDPQHRVFTECAYEALEDAGRLGLSRISRTGVFASANYSGYREILTRAGHPAAGLEFESGTDKDFLATRVAYTLDLHGICVTVQTACSSSLVAVHLACQALREFEADQALAGGVSVVFPDAPGWQYEPRGIHSPDGVCRPFDAAAGGTVMGDGAAVAVLRRLQDALADGDNVYAIILGSAVNNDGSRKLGYAAPGFDGQLEVVLAAHARAGVTAGQISYVEAHGTGTPLGDSIELASLTEAFTAQAPASRFCRLSSVKGAIGHLDNASGATGLIRASLALTHKMLPGTTGHATPSPALAADASPFTVSPATTPWDAAPPRRAAVSSLGVGGTNAHIVLEEPPPESSARRGQTLHPVLVSAKTPEALRQARQRLAAAIGDGSPRLGDIAYTLAAGRDHFPRRAAILARSRPDAIRHLRVGPAASPAQPPPVLIFGFPGQGAGLAGAGRILYETEPAFAACLDDCAQRVSRLGGPDLRNAMLAQHAHTSGPAPTSLAQPLMVTIGYALTRLLASWGLHPAACVGHSLGEITAALSAGLTDLDAALALAVHRGAAMEHTPPGAMLAIALPEHEARALLPPGIEVAAVNSPRHTVAAGPRDPVMELASALAGQGVRCEVISGRCAFHTPLMADAAAHLAVPDPPPAAGGGVRCLSGVTGTWLTAPPGTGHWQRHAVAPVRFSQCLATATQEYGDIVVADIGPGDMIARAAAARGDPHVRAVACLRHRGAASEREALTIAVARLWEHGIDADWTRILSSAGRRVPLPGYPFQRRRCWPASGPAPQPAGEAAGRQKAGLPMPGGVHVRAAAWQELPPRGTQRGRPGPSQVVLLHGTDPMGQALRERCQSAFPGALAAVAGTRRCGDGQALTIRPDSARDMRWLLERATPRPARYLVICAWGIAQPDPREALRATYGTLLALAQAHLPAAGPGVADVVIVTRGAQQVLGDEAAHPWLAAVTGLARVASQECPRLRARVIDLEPAAPPEAAAALLAEAAAWTPEPVIALRGRRRWVLRYDPAAEAGHEIPARTGQSGSGSGGADIVIGGTGLIGGAAARALAARGQPTIILAQRTIDSNQPQLGERLSELSALGARAEAETVDAGDPASVQDLIGRVLGRFGAIGTIVHAAGTSGDGAYQPLAQVPPWDRDPHLRVKATGLAALAEATDARPVGRVVLMSSLSAVLGALHLGSYAAASAVMDAFASRPGADGPAWLSIGWDAWQAAGTALSAAEERMTASGLTIPAAEQVLARLLAGACEGHVLVTRDDFSQRWDRYVARPLARASLSPGNAAPRPPGDSRPPGSASVGALVLGAWRRCLDDPALAPADNVFSRGADSLTGMEALEMISGELGLQLPARLVFEAATPAALTARVQALASFGQAGRNAANTRVRTWNTSGPALWFLHPVSGDAECYEPLARALGGYRCHAVAGAPLADVRGNEDVEALAARYLTLLASHGPPAVICGWSYGAILALETAQQLRQSTGAVPALVVVDMPVPDRRSGRDPAFVTDAELLAALGMHRARELQCSYAITARDLSADADAAFGRVLGQLREQRLIPRAFPAHLARRLAAGYRYRLAGAGQYRPVPYPGPVTVIRAAEPEFGDSGLMDSVLPAPAGDPSWGWAALADGGCDVQVIDGHHSTLLTAGSAIRVARLITAAASRDRQKGT